MNLEIPNKKVLEKIQEYDEVKKVALQSPDGLKEQEIELSQYLKQNGYETYIYPRTFGSCDLADEEAKRIGSDLLIHLGHAPMPISSDIPIIFAPVFLEIEDIEKLIEDNIEKIKELGDKIGLVTTVQHVKDLPKIKEKIENYNIEVKIEQGDSRNAYKGQILGCNFTAATRISEKVDGFLFIGGGAFHPKGLAMSTEKKVLSLEPFGGRIEEINRDELIKKRWGQIAMAQDAENFAVIISTKKGQLRLKEAKKVTKKLKNKGKKVETIFMNHITPEHLQNYRNFEAYIIIACPRIPIDDVGKYEKPIITPAELDAVLGSEEISMDEIKGIEEKFNPQKYNNFKTVE